MTSLLFGRTDTTKSSSRKSQRDWFRIKHLPHKSTISFSGETNSFGKESAHGRLIVNGSTTGWVSPTRSDILSIFHDAGHGRIVIRIGEHLRAPRFVVLRVVVDERNTF